MPPACNKSIPRRGFVRPKSNFVEPTIKLRSKSESRAKLSGRQVLNFQEIYTAAINSTVAVTPRSPKSSKRRKIKPASPSISGLDELLIFLSK